MLAVESKADIQSRHRRLNPMNSSSSRRKAQEARRRSKAFAMSIFNSIDGRLTECSSRQVSWTVWKLSWMLRPRMKALWLGRTRSLRNLASRLAKHFDTSLAKLWMRLIGLQSLISSGLTFFLRSIKKASLRRLRLLKSLDQRALKARMTSSLMIGQARL